MSGEPHFAYRTWYGWDHSTNWDLSQPVTRVFGCHEPYSKPAQAFVADYQRQIDYMGALGLNHLIVWGALRDTHGGVAALRQIVEYGQARGVRVAPGVGVNCYGGVYYEGDHEFSLVRLLRERPELAAVDGQGRPRLDKGNANICVACPRNQEVRDWTVRSLDWLMRQVGPTAIHFETGDYGVCHCAHCRAQGPREGSVSDADMAVVLPPVIEAVRAHSKDCWLSYNHYFGYTQAMMKDRPAFARAIQDDVICKWGVSWMLDPKLAPRDLDVNAVVEAMTPNVKPPTKTNMAHFHFGSGWWNCSPRGTLEITRMMKAMPLLKAVGFQGVCTHAEESPLNPSCELNYHVYAALACDPDAEPADVAKRSVGELYESTDLATEVLMAYKTQRLRPGLCAEVARAAAKAQGQLKVRLNWLTFALHRLAEVSWLQQH